MMIRVAIVADIRLYREGLAEFLRRHPAIAVVATVADWSQSLVAVHDLEPDVVLLDMAMPDGILAVRSIAAAVPAAKVVAVAVPDSERDVIACVEAGVAGYITREASVEELVQATIDAARGELHLPPRMAARLFRHVAEMATERPGPEARLTTRELEIVDLIDDGLSNKQIAQRLCIEVPTVKNHVHNILEKLHVDRRSEAAARIRARRPRHRAATLQATAHQRV